jgi:hypothetical protein
MRTPVYFRASSLSRGGTESPLACRCDDQSHIYLRRQRCVSLCKTNPCLELRQKRNDGMEPINLEDHGQVSEIRLSRPNNSRRLKRWR